MDAGNGRDGEADQAVGAYLAAVASFTGGGDNRDPLAEADFILDIAGLEAAFIQHARAYGQRHGITYEAWRRRGVLPAVLHDAGIATGDEHG